jgi:hypothetical protein
MIVGFPYLLFLKRSYSRTEERERDTLRRITYIHTTGSVSLFLVLAFLVLLMVG